MTMGVIRGAFFGLVLGGAGVSVASVLGPQPAGNAPPATPPLVDAPQTAEVSTPPATVPTAPNPTDTAPQVATPQVTAPEPQAPAIEGDTAPLAPPAAADIADAPEAPAASEQPDVAADAEAPVLPSPQSLAPQVPANEENLVVDTAPAAPVVVDDASGDDAEVVVEALEVETPPVVVADEAADPVDPGAVETAQANSAAVAPAEEVAAAPAQDITETTAPETVETATASVEAPVSDLADTLDQPAPEQVVPVAPDADTSAAAADEAAAVVTAEDGEAPVVVADAEPAVVAEDAEPAVVADTAPVQPSEDVIAGAEVIEDSTAPSDDAADTPVVVSLIDGASSSLPQGDSGVRINRVGEAAEASEEPAEGIAEPAEATGVALVDYAADFDNPEGKPLVSLILLDEGRIEAGPALLAQLPFAVTVMVDAGQPDAAEKMAAYRAAGIEVGAALRLPMGATASDVEIALEAARASIGEAVIVTDLGTAERAAREQMILALAVEGRGFLSLSAGLGNGLREAEAAGVPAASVFRDLDSEDQDARVIRRFLDQAAFRARQDSGVVLLGRVRPDTLSALTLWGTANRAGQVMMAPVSAVLTEESDS